MHGESLQIWIDRLTLSIIKKDTDAIDYLLDTMPKFSAVDDMKEIKEVLYLFKEALELLYVLRDETAVSMRQIKRNIDFLGANMSNTTNRLNVKS